MGGRRLERACCKFVLHRPSTDSLRLADSVRFSASIRQQIYSGATELLELQTTSNLVLRARIASRAQLSGSHDFVFAASDAVAVSE